MFKKDKEQEEVAPLVETSSIFTRNGNPVQLELNNDSADDEVVKSETEELISQIEEEVSYCRTLKFNGHSDNGNLLLVEFFPDSRFGILYDANHDHYLISNLDGDSFIVEVPMLDYKVIAVAQEVILIEAETLEGPRMIKFIGNDYFFLEGALVEEDEENIIINKNSYCKLSTEEKEAEVINNKIRLFYKDVNLIINDGIELIEEDKRTGKLALMSDENGCYIGFYLPVNHGDGLINFQGMSFKILSRLTISLIVARSVRDHKTYLVPCREQLLIPIEELTDTEWENIEVVNGIALLFGNNPNSSKKLHVFTPSWQKVCLSKGMKMSFRHVGNGIIIPKDNVLILDTGMLRFVDNLSTKQMHIPKEGLDVDLPIKYLGDL